MQGIYAITNSTTGEQYVGKARNVYRRWSQHAHLLARGTHHSPSLAQVWSEYGPTGFTWIILQVVEDKANLPRAEREHITRLPPIYNYQTIPPRFKAAVRDAPGLRGLALPCLRAWRASRVLTQEELAEKAGVARATVVRGERGGTPSLDNIRKIAAALGITPERLADGPPDGD